MPIYAYRCESCGFTQDVLQKRTDPVLETCPTCGAPAFRKQLSAPSFQLKGSGWYATDFRDNGKAKPGADKGGEGGEGGEGGAAAEPAGSPVPDAAPGAVPAAAAGAPAPAAAPAAPASAPASAPSGTKGA